MKIRVNNSSVFYVEELDEEGVYTEGDVHFNVSDFEVVDWGNFYELAKKCKDYCPNCPCWFDYKLYEIEKEKEANNTMQVTMIVEGAKQPPKKFNDVTNEMVETYVRKNHDYGNSFDATLDEFGIVAAVVRMNDKMNRLKKLIKESNQVKDESIRDTLMDLANYSAMTALYLDNHKN